MNAPLDQWFAEEILPHEAVLTRYLARVWGKPADIGDLRQDIYVRVYAGAAQQRPHNPKAFLFATARNLMTDRLRRGRIVSIDFTQDLESLDVLIDQVSPEQRLSARQELRRLSDALDALPNNCRDVIWLRRVEGLSQQETARRLGMKEGTVESHLSRGVRALAKVVFGSARTGSDADDEANSRKEPGDGRRRHE